MSITNGYELIHPDYYAEHGPPYAIWDRLRAESPVHRCEVDDVEPFWAVTRQEDIKYISKTPELFVSEPGITLIPTDRVISDDEGLGAMRVVKGFGGEERETARFERTNAEVFGQSMRAVRFCAALRGLVVFVAVIGRIGVMLVGV